MTLRRATAPVVAVTEAGREVTAGTPTQVAHPWQAVKRTVAVLIAGLMLVIGVIALALEVFDGRLDENLVGWLTGASTLLGLAVTFLQRLMVLEQLQGFLARVGLGTGVDKEAPVALSRPPGISVGALGADAVLQQDGSLTVGAFPGGGDVVLQTDGTVTVGGRALAPGEAVTLGNVTITPDVDETPPPAGYTPRRARE